MVQSSRVRTVAATATSIQSAYFAFQDRYSHVAGDWNAVDAGNAIGQTVNGGDDSGHLDPPPGDPWTESNAFWEQLARAGFVRGLYQGTPATEPTLDNDLTPASMPAACYWCAPLAIIGIRSQSPDHRSHASVTSKYHHANRHPNLQRCQALCQPPGTGWSGSASAAG
jgi:hypothetical protein